MPNKKTAFQAAGDVPTKDKQLVVNSQKIRQEISKGRFRISQLAFADFEFKQSPDLDPGKRFSRIVLLGRLQDNIGFGVDLLKAVTKLRTTFSDNQKEIGKAMKKGGDLQEYLYAAIMLPATQLEVAKDLMGDAVVQVSHAVRSKAPTATRGIQALQELLGDPHLRGLEILTLGQAISQHNSAMCETEAGAEVLCSVLRKVVKLVGQEATSNYKPHTKQAITLLAGVCQEVANNSKWRYAHQAFEPILEVVQVVKQPWRNQVAGRLVQPVVERAESDPAALSLLVGYCIEGRHRVLLERVTSELGHTDILKLLMSQGKEGAVLRLLKHHDSRPVTQRMDFKLLQPVVPQLYLLRNSPDNIITFLDILNLKMMTSRQEEQIEGVQEHWKPGQLKALRREANAQVDKGTPHQILADRLIQAEGLRRSASSGQNIALGPASPTGQAAPGLLAAAEEAGPAAAQPEEAVPAAEQPAEAMPAGASSADTAAGLSAQDQPSASSPSVPRSVSEGMYEKAVKLTHLAASIDVADPLHSQQAAASWKENMLELAKLTCQLALCVGPDFPSQPDDIKPMELARTLAMFCEVNFDKTTTSIPAPAPKVAAAPGIAPASISAVRPVSSDSSNSSDSGAFRSASFQRRPSRLGPAGGGSGA